ncbi:serine/threonine-protein kinase [Nocardia crassostreae]|uniref:serine/threonine-protein kinase n=1 Tax=Nocardia crassostreae TaxID=53428 RepID=UPI000836A057|nr:serine/threonine-protein kinase [Nocardia crassostreae]
MSERWPPGTIFAGFRIERLLGRGGMGSVYLARHPRLPRLVALKVLPGSLGADSEYRLRFEREAELAARLDHPNIVQVWDRGIENGLPWIAMQFVDGPDVAAVLRRTNGGLPPALALDILTQAASGLDEAHRSGLLHRDVKPANFLIESGSARTRVYVADFGIARTFSHHAALTRPGAIVGTAAYAAPEQIEAEELDHRVDVYALACALHELLTGRKPFPRTSDVEVLVAHLHDPPPRATAIDPQLPPAIDEVIARAMAKSRADRFESCGELAAAAVAAFTSEQAPRAPRSGRPKWRAAGVALVSIAVVAAVSFFVVNRNPDVDTIETSPTPSTSVPVEAPTWRNFDFVVQTFPGLLPPTQLSSGFQGATCVASGTDLKAVDPGSAVGIVAVLSCRGNGQPAEFFWVGCNSDRSVAPVELGPRTQIVGEESWERASGRGRLVWWTETDDGGSVVPGLMVSFEDSRNFCRIEVIGSGSARDLVDRWFALAPI